MSTSAIDTLGLLEQRLARLEFQLGSQTQERHNNESNGVTSTDEAVGTHILRLQSRFKQLCTNNAEAANILRLCESPSSTRVVPYRTEP